MNKQNSFNYIWPTLFGSFYNSEHQNIKYELINFFEKYKIENPSGRKAGENLKLYESKYDLHRQNNEIIQNFFKNFIVKSFFETELIFKNLIQQDPLLILELFIIKKLQ